MEKKYKFTTFDSDGNELRFDMTELQYMLKEKLFIHDVPTFNQMLEILKITDEKAKKILASKSGINKFKAKLKTIKE